MRRSLASWCAGLALPRVIALSLVLVIVPLGAMADITITVLPSIAPNAFGSPSFGTYANNAMNALENGLSSNGTPNTPGYYQQAGSTISANQILVTSFNSWLGQPDPGTVFGPQYANELGNRLHFGLVILGNGTQFSISQLSFTGTSTDPGDALGFSYGTGSYDYSPYSVGYIASSNTWVTGGPNTQMVDALYRVGSGNAFWPCDGSTCSTVAQQQQAINATLWSMNDFDFSGTYSLDLGGGNSISDTGTVHVQAVPEPGSLLLLGSGLLGLLKLRKRRV